MKRALLVSSASPYPVVTNGCERLVLDYQRKVFCGYDVHFVATQPGTWDAAAWIHGDERRKHFEVDHLLDLDFVFAFFVGFRASEFAMRVVKNIPSFCLTDTHPHPDIPDGLFRGILSHRAAARRSDILLCGGMYDCEVFYKDRTGEDLIVSVGRIHPDKNQVDLVSQYRNRIYDRYGLPLYLIGGVGDPGYYHKVDPYIDQVSVRSTIDQKHTDALKAWCSPAEIAAVLNRARFFVSASPMESFGIALAEAMACGTTCVLNGSFPGFDSADLGPHVFGNITGQHGSIVDILEEALATNARRDGSEWIKQYSIRRAAERQMEFIERRLRHG